jgi:hypothetical protein
MSAPRWRALPASERQFAWRCCVHPLLARWEVPTVKSVLLGLVLWASWLLGAFSAGWLLGILPLIAFFFAGELLDLALVIYYRPRILASLSTTVPTSSAAA